MKKYFFLALTAIVSLVFAACSEDLSSFTQREGDVDVTYTVSTLSTPNSRATHDGDGNAKSVNRYICEVWNVESDGALTLYKRVENVVGSGILNTTFTLRLVSKQSYKVLFWADHAEVVGVGEVDGNNITAADIYYDTKTANGLQEVTLKKDENNKYVGNNDEMDAFFAVETINNLNGTVDKTSDDNHVILKRPFAQLNVITTDIDDIRKNAVTSTMNPNKIKMTVNAPTKFNVLTGEATAEEDIEYTAAVYYNISGVNKKADDSNYSNSYAYCTLAMNYYFAPADEKAVETVSFEALNGDKSLVSPVYANIPLQRNYRTNIIGNLLTDDVNYNVTIDQNWNTPENDVHWTKVATVADIATAFAEGKTNVEVLEAPTSATTIEIPKTFSASNNNSVGIKLPETDKQITFEYKSSDTQSAPANINIVAENSSDKVVINCPESHVTLNGVYVNVDASTSSSTLVVDKGVTITGTLTVTEGGVEIHGSVKALVVTPASGKTVVFRACEGLSDAVYNAAKNYIDPDYTAKKQSNGTWNIETSGIQIDALGVYHVRNAEGMVEFASKVNGGTTFSGKTVVLDNDIDLANVAWTPIGNVTSYPSITFHGTFDGQNHTIKNLTTSDNLQNYAAAGLFGSICGTIKNLTVENATVTSTHYAGVICGYSSANTATVIENCHVKNATVTSTPESISGSYDNGDKVGGIIGYIVSGDKVTGCSVENVTVKAYRDLGAVVGCATGGAATGVTNNSAKDCTVIQCNKNGYKNEAITTYGEIIGRHGNDVPESNTVTNVTLQSVAE